MLNEFNKKIADRMARGDVGEERPDREINQVYVLVSEGRDGKEGLVGTFPPFIFSDRKTADLALKMMRPSILKQSKEAGVKIKLMRFCFRETLERIE
jgi:hypothetical protein